MRDFIKSEIARELNLKICDLYQDEELSITDKVRALLPPATRALTFLMHEHECRVTVLVFRTRLTARCRRTCVPTSFGAPWRTRATGCSSSSRKTRRAAGEGAGAAGVMDNVTMA